MNFQNRHIGPSASDTTKMLSDIGENSLDDLIKNTVPAHIIRTQPLSIGEPMSEKAFIDYIKTLGEKNKVADSYIGMGYYPTITPPVILRNVFENPGWYTQYTPYQAEISQGRLEALMNFQTMVSDLTGLPVANASLLDEATAAAEAMIMAFHNTRSLKLGNKFFVESNVFPQTLDVLYTRANPLGIDIVVADVSSISLDKDFFGILLQYPDVNGLVNDYSQIIALAKSLKIISVVAADLMGLVLLKSPGEMGADIAVGTTQRFGVPMGYGGPHAAYFAVRDEFKRVIPGRIIGASVDALGNLAYRMALQTREQHIRREKATSNICTAQVLLAVMAGMYAVYHGPDGLLSIAQSIHNSTRRLEEKLVNIGFRQLNKYYFDTLRFKLSEVQIVRLKNLAEQELMNFRYTTEGEVTISLFEGVNETHLNKIMKLFSAVGSTEKSESGISEILPDNLKRQTKFLTHPVFNKYHSELEMMRYIKRLENKDLSLTASMIPLGSCTMKLNAASEMLMLSNPLFSDIHPFAPTNQVTGYLELIDELENALKEITGFPGVSLQPNSGAQGEYTGLMVIREYFRSRGESNKNVVLIPSSAHGTNPASAVMAGMKVVVVNCDDHGNIDIADLQQKAEKFKDNLAALMVTYPSTHGVFESGIKEICNIIHSYGGQVYMDGANMNAQVGLTSPSIIGADVCHLNLHKTFAIPHGGGGPGMGPICVAEHLKPFLPGHCIIKTGGESAMKAVSAAPFGSALILIISLGYIKMLGGSGLTEATRYAILNANYLKSKLEPYYKILYSGDYGRVAHEMIFDFREFKKTANVEVEDIAKRLMDYGFHAPTVSFPVAGTLMVEPTESESKYELDRFIEAMISIRQEIAEIESGKADPLNNVLKNAPHTARMVTSDEWKFPYSREKAAYPVASLKGNKFWPSVARINNAQGDRNLVCSCNSIMEYAETSV